MSQAANPFAQEAITQLCGALDEAIDALRAQRDLLRQRGMGLPPGTLAGLRQVRSELEALAGKLGDSSVELEHFRALAETTTLVNSSLDLNQVLNEVMDTVIRLTGAERGYIVLREGESGEVTVRIARNLDRETMDESNFIVSRTIVQEVADSGEPVVTTNAQSDPRFSGQESIMLHALRSILCVPLIVKDRVTGVVYADNRIRDGLFGQRELALLVAFANQAAVAIENARLFESVQRALAEITEIKELMDNVFASIASGVITTDVTEQITTYNLAAERILGVPQVTALGSALAAAMPEIYAPIQNLINLVYEQSYHDIIEIESELPDRGPRNLNLSLTPLKNQEQIEGVAIVVDDLTEIKQRDATLNVVRRYLPPAMVDNIQSLDGLALGGERRLITVLFVEVRPFDSFGPDLAPHDLMARLNLFLTMGAEAIHSQNGVIDKFMGNEIMGLFNTQLNPSEDHAWLAVQAALKLADDYLPLMLELGEPAVPYFRTGIHTGVATMGNVGSLSRREFTAIGDTVNLGKRLQENAATGEIIVSRDTLAACADRIDAPDSQLLVTEKPSIQVKGRSQATQIFAIQRRPAPVG